MTKKSGFTMIEIAVVIGLFAILISLGLLMGMDVWRGSSMQSEQEIVLSLLYKARSRAISNINESNHGLYIDEAGEQYIIFEGDDYDSASPDNIPFDIGGDFDFEPDNPKIIFTARTGPTDAPPCTMTGQGKNRTFCINEEGGITWQNNDENCL